MSRHDNDKSNRQRVRDNEETELNNSLESGESTAENISSENNPQVRQVAATEFLAKNNSSAKESYIERTNYKKDAYPDYEQSPVPIDLWYEKGLYGKVNPDYETVITSDNWDIGAIVVPVLKKIPGDEEQIFAMNFVVDAFVDLQQYMYEAANRGQLATSDSILMPFKAKKGWESFENKYRKYFEELYTGFASTYLNQQQNYKKIKDIRGFMSTFSGFVERVLPDFPMSSTGYVLSSRYPLISTGLVIELSDSDHGDDEIKYEDYISDNNFLFYIGAARKFGFMIDKNAPWRLVADIKSKKMQSYMNRYPEQPVNPGDPGEAPQELCSLSFELFEKYYNQKIEFISTEMIEGLMSVSGKIREVICDARQPQNTFFRIATYCPGSDEDLYDTTGEEIPEFYASWAPRDNISNINPTTNPSSLGSVTTQTPSADLTLIGVQSGPEISLTSWINTVMANNPTSGIPIRIFGSSNVDEYRWRILDKPAGAAVRFLNYRDVREIKGMAPDYDEAYTTKDNPNIRFVIYTASDPQTGIIGSSEIVGDYLISVEGINLADPNRPVISQPRFLTLRVCTDRSLQINLNFVDNVVPLRGTSWQEAMANVGSRVPGGWSSPDAAEDSLTSADYSGEEYRQRLIAGLERRWIRLLNACNAEPLDVTYPDPSENIYIMRDGKVCDVSTVAEYDVPVFLSSTPSELQFTMTQADNIQFTEERRLFENSVNSYSTRLDSYNQRVDAKNLYELQLEQWKEIHQSNFLGGPLTFDNIFFRQFINTSTIDLTFIKQYVLDFYNSYVMDQPSFSETKVRTDGVGTTMCTVNRQLITKDSFESIYPDSFWLQFYFSLRIMESQINVPPDVIKNFRQKIITQLLSLPQNTTRTQKNEALNKLLQIITNETKGVIK